MAVSQKTLDVLEPWLEDSGPNAQDEWGMYCPFHDDRKRSASLNVESGLFYCQTCDWGCPVRKVTQLISTGEVKNDRSQVQSSSSGGKRPEPLSDARVAGWSGALLGNKSALRTFQRARGLDRSTIEAYEIGWDSGQSAYTIPVYDEGGQLLNVRRYSLDPGDRRKMWSVAGHGTPVLYPIEGWEQWDEDVILCEGELDALATIQRGFTAVTRTGSAKTWRPAEWNHYFRDKVVYLCHDMDKDGQQANRMHATSLSAVTKAVYIVTLPYEVTPDHGKDITDYWKDGHEPDDFKSLMAEAQLWSANDERTGDIPIEDVALLDSFNPERVGQQLRMRVTITGRRTPNYLVPKMANFNCDQKAGPAKCGHCCMGPEGTFNGAAGIEITSNDGMLLEFMNANNVQVDDLLRRALGAVKCGRLNKEILKYHSMEELWVRPSVEQASTERDGHTNRELIAVNKYDTQPNNTVEVLGAVLPNPRSQRNEFQAWELINTATNVDHFDVTDEAKRHLSKFQVRGTQTPLVKAQAIAHDLSENVTHIYQRDDMHIFFDLVFHSALHFNFMGKPVDKGWLDAIIVGDTRTGKSEIATRLVPYYGAGELVSCEGASFAGVVGGLQQVGGKDWVVTWGAVPLNDRRLVVLDEVSEFEHQQIASMSSIRSAGVAQLTKIRAERTPARTRLLWLSNARGGVRMADFTYGVQAIRPLIGNNEDIARFDMAMTVASGEVDAEAYNVEASENVASRRYSSAACRTLINWAWTRKPEHIVWAAGAEQAVLDAAKRLGEEYQEDPPLVQAANVRLKVARIAVALAIRVCSTDKTFEKVLVRKEHVKDAVKFLNRIYGSPGFGYKDISDESNKDKAVAQDRMDDAKGYLVSKPGLSKFLRGAAGHFRRIDMEDMLNMSKEEANATINTLYKFRMIRRDQANIKINPELHQLLREIEE